MIPAERAHLHVAASTHPGMSGKNNEDRFVVTALRIEGERPLAVVFAVVSDGIGGHRAGEVAAQTAVETLTETLANSDGTRPVEALHQAVQAASQAILEQSQNDQGKQGMGATCACALVIDNRLFTVSVGDSRIYLLRGDTIRQLDIDHTWVQEAIDAGMLTPEQARGHPNAHVIRRYLGSPQPVAPDMRLRLSSDETDEQMMANQGMALEACDQILLCSDGLTDLVSPEEILSVLKENDQQKAVQSLIDLANSRGGHDNITIVVLQYPASVAETTPTVPHPQPRRAPALAFNWNACLIGVIALAILTAAALGGYLLLTGASLSGSQASATPAPSSSAQPGVTAATTAVVSRTPAATRFTPTPGGRTPTVVTATSTVWVTSVSTLPAATLTPWPTSTP